MAVKKVEHAKKNQTFTEKHVYEAFFTGMAAGMAAEDGTYGEEDFMNAAWAKAAKFIKGEEGGDWTRILRYCGSDLPLLEGEVRYTLGNTGATTTGKAAKAGK